MLPSFASDNKTISLNNCNNNNFGCSTSASISTHTVSSHIDIPHISSVYTICVLCDGPLPLVENHWFGIKNFDICIVILKEARKKYGKSLEIIDILMHEKQKNPLNKFKLCTKCASKLRRFHQSDTGEQIRNELLSKQYVQFGNHNQYRNVSQQSTSDDGGSDIMMNVDNKNQDNCHKAVKNSNNSEESTNRQLLSTKTPAHSTQSQQIASFSSTKKRKFQKNKWKKPITPLILRDKLYPDTNEMFDIMQETGILEWLDFSGDLFYCVPCRKYESSSHYGVGLRDSYIQLLLSHSQTSKHISLSAKYKEAHGGNALDQNQNDEHFSSIVLKNEHNIGVLVNAHNNSTYEQNQEQYPLQKETDRYSLQYENANKKRRTTSDSDNNSCFTNEYDDTASDEDNDEEDVFSNKKSTYRQFKDLSITTKELRESKYLQDRILSKAQADKWLDYSTDYFFCRACVAYSTAKHSCYYWNSRTKFKTTKFSLILSHSGTQAHVNCVDKYENEILMDQNSKKIEQVVNKIDTITGSSSSNESMTKSRLSSDNNIYDGFTHTWSSARKTCWCDNSLLCPALLELLDCCTNSPVHRVPTTQYPPSYPYIFDPIKFFSFPNLLYLRNVTKTILPFVNVIDDNGNLIKKQQNGRPNPYDDSLTWQEIEHCVCGTTVVFYYKQHDLSKTLNGEVQLMQIKKFYTSKTDGKKKMNAFIKQNGMNNTNSQDSINSFSSL